jgi:hypothetical protein
VDPSAENYDSWTPYNYCADNPINLVDLDGMDWYQWKGEDGKQAVTWREGDAKSIDINGQSYSNIGTTYTTNVDKNTTITYTQNEATSMTTNTMNSSEWVSQYSKADWDGTPASKACNKASEAMLGKDGDASNGTTKVIVNSAGDGRAGTANSGAARAIKSMSTALDFDKPTKVNVDFRSGSGSNDKMGDHFIVVMGKTETLSGGKATSTTFRFFDPGTNHQSKGTASTNTLRVVNNRLVGTHINNGLPIVVSNIRPTR